jgi:hypothetical protein
MPIPLLQEDGLLPPGLHLAEMDEIEERFGKSTSRRKTLFIRLRLFVELSRHCSALRILVDTEPKWNGWVEFFSQVRRRLNKRKGLVEVKLT